MASFKFNTYTDSNATYCIEDSPYQSLYLTIFMTDDLNVRLSVIDATQPNLQTVDCPDLKVYIISQYTGELIQSQYIQNLRFTYILIQGENYLIKYKGKTIFKLQKVKGWDVLVDDECEQDTSVDTF